MFRRVGVACCVKVAKYFVGELGEPSHRIREARRGCRWSFRCSHVLPISFPPRGVSLHLLCLENSTSADTHIFPRQPPQYGQRREPPYPVSHRERSALVPVAVFGRPVRTGKHLPYRTCAGRPPQDRRDCIPPQLLPRSAARIRISSKSTSVPISVAVHAVTGSRLGEAAR